MDDECWPLQDAIMKVFSPPRLRVVRPPSCGPDLCGPDLPVVAAGPSLAVQHALLAGRQWLLDRHAGAGQFRSTARRPPAEIARRLLAAWRPDGNPSDRGRLLQRLFNAQLPAGGWAADGSRGRGVFDLGVSLLCYAAIKLHGGADAIRPLQRAARAIRAAGGAAAAPGEATAWLVWTGQCEPDNQWLAGAPAVVRAALADRPDGVVAPLKSVRELMVGGTPAPSGQRWRLDDDGQRVWQALLKRRRQAAAGATPGEQGGTETPLDSELQATCAAAAAVAASGLEADVAELSHARARLIERALAFDSTTPFVDLVAVLATLRSIRRRNGRSSDLPPPIRLARREAVETPPASDANEAIQRVVDLLQALQSGTGDWGRGDARGTAAAVGVLAGEEEARLATHRGAAWLVDTQHADGSWPGGGDHATITVATAEAVLALAACRATVLEEPLLAGVNWLLANAAADDNLAKPSGPVAFLAAARAVEAFAATGFAAHPAATSAADELLATQQESGEWAIHGGDRLTTTASAVSALAAWLPRVDEPTERRAPTRRVCLRLVGVEKVVG